MKPIFKYDCILMKVAMCCAIINLLSGSVLSAQPFKLMGVSDLERVFEDGYKLPVTYDTIKIFGIRGEIISGQCVLYANKNLIDVKVEIGTLKDPVSGKLLPAESASWNFVGSIPLTKNTPNQPLSALTRPAPSRYPDYLMSERSMNVNKGVYQSVWLTVSIPLLAEKGSYTGRITVKSLEGEQSLPLCITVFPYDLPEKRHLKVVEWVSTSQFERFHGIKEKYSPEWFSMLRKYADNMVAHRQNTFRVPMNVIAISRSKSGELVFDFSRFDQLAQLFWDTKKMDYMETGFLARFGEKEWADTEILLNNFNVRNSENDEKISMKGEEAIPSLLPAFESHLRGKGWLDKTLFHIQDEPSMHNARAWLEISSYLHKYAPDLRRMDAIETTFLLSDIEVAVPKLDHFSNWNETYNAWLKKGGNELWFYTVGIYQGSLFPNKTIDVPLIDSRIMHWLNYKYDATGYLHWGWNQWTDNPYQDPDIHIGDGWHVYPVKDGVLNSLRWEEMRNGIQDYEYFWMLENKIKALKDSLGTRFSWIDPKQRGKEIAGKVVFGYSDRTNDPVIFYEAKMYIIRELSDLSHSPGLYVQTNPRENSTITDGSSVELLGWTETGTRIVVNGRELPVSEEGLFLEQFQMSGGDNKIIVQAGKGNRSKEIVREFVVR